MKIVHIDRSSNQKLHCTILSKIIEKTENMSRMEVHKLVDEVFKLKVKEDIVTCRAIEFRIKNVKK